MNNQAYLFFMFIINGILIGLLFDIFRIVRKSFKTSDLVTYIEDILFWILTGILTLYFIFTYNNGEIRLYIFLGILLGTCIYMLTISSYLINLSVRIITIIKGILIKLVKVLIYPFQIILCIVKKILFRPFSFIFINIRKSFCQKKQNLLNFAKKIQKSPKNQT